MENGEVGMGVLLSDPNEFISENIGFWKGT